jgi:hypothetical protein
MWDGVEFVVAEPAAIREPVFQFLQFQSIPDPPGPLLSFADYGSSFLHMPSCSGFATLITIPVRC